MAFEESLLKKNPGCSVWWTGSCPICSSSDRLSVGGSCDHCEIRKSQNNEVYSKQIGLSFVDPDTIHEPKVLLNTSKEKPPNPKKFISRENSSDLDFDFASALSQPPDEKFFFSDTESSIEMMAISLNTQLKNVCSEMSTFSPQNSTNYSKDVKSRWRYASETTTNHTVSEFTQSIDSPQMRRNLEYFEDLKKCYAPLMISLSNAENSGAHDVKLQKRLSSPLFCHRHSPITLGLEEALESKRHNNSILKPFRKTQSSFDVYSRALVKNHSGLNLVSLKESPESEDSSHLGRTMSNSNKTENDSKANQQHTPKEDRMSSKIEREDFEESIDLLTGIKKQESSSSSNNSQKNSIKKKFCSRSKRPLRTTRLPRFYGDNVFTVHMDLFELQAKLEDELETLQSKKYSSVEEESG